MISFFPKSRRMAWMLGTAFGICGGLLGWLLAQGRIAGLGGMAVAAALTAFLGVSLAVYATRIAATKEYQNRLLYLYEELDPQKFLEALLPLRRAKMVPSMRGTLMTHIANGYLYGGEIQKALEALDEIEVPEKAVGLLGMVLSNKVSCCLMGGQLDMAEELLRQLQQLIGRKKCTEEFRQKVRHAIAYQELGLAIRRGKNIDVSVLEHDFSTSRSPLHKLDVQYQIALFHQGHGRKELYQAAKEYVCTHGAKTALPSLLP